MAFTFSTVPSIISAPGAIARLGEIAKARLGARALVVTDPLLVKLGIVERGLDSLRKAGVEASVFDAVEADPPEACVMAAVEMARGMNATGIVGFGGGSSLDVAKLVALLVKTPQSLASTYGVGKASDARLPLILAPTTAGTGSEATAVAVVTTTGADKMGTVSPLLLPDVALLDPELTLGLPPAVTAATGIDAMVHAIEAFTSINPNNSPLSQALAREALRLLGANIRKVVDNGADIAAREAMLNGSLLAGMAFANASVGAVHALAYPLGGHYHLPHGLTNALVMPEVMRFNAPACAAQYAHLAHIVFDDAPDGDDARVADFFIESLAKLATDIGIPARLRDVKITENALSMLAADVMKQTRLLVNNPRPVTEEDALAIYRQAF
jgi:alcohol dehydrogenase class IV